MYCPKCGAQVPDNIHICPYCKAPLPAVPPPQQEPQYILTKQQNPISLFASNAKKRICPSQHSAMILACLVLLIAAILLLRPLFRPSITGQWYGDLGIFHFYSDGTGMRNNQEFSYRLSDDQTEIIVMFESGGAETYDIILGRDTLALHYQGQSTELHRVK